MTLLTLFLNSSQIGQIDVGRLPTELRLAMPVLPGATVDLVDSAGRRHTHSLAELSGWAHFSLRVHANRACQADCFVTASEVLDPDQIICGDGRGIRFQPFFLPGSPVEPATYIGQGLFRRGLHFRGSVTPGWVRLSCECDYCSRSFQVQSFHAGFGDVGYFYSDSGAYTLLVDAGIDGAPPALGQPALDALAALEARLPLAPDGGRYRYLNPFRCPHCSQPYIDFERHPDLRAQEYYGNTLFGVEPERYGGNLGGLA